MKLLNSGLSHEFGVSRAQIGSWRRVVAVADVIDVILRDAAEIEAESAERLSEMSKNKEKVEPLFTYKDVRAIYSHLKTYDYYKEFKAPVEELFERKGKLINALIKEQMTFASNHLFNIRFSLSDIGKMCGFSSASSFSRAFKNYTSVSPTYWKKIYPRENVINSSSFVNINSSQSLKK